MLEDLRGLRALIAQSEDLRRFVQHPALPDEKQKDAIKAMFGEGAYGIPVSSTKSMLGHSLGAAGALEAVPCVRSITEGLIHPTVNYEFTDPECDLDYVPNEARKKDVRVVLSNAFGFGGQNACLVYKRYEED